MFGVAVGDVVVRMSALWKGLQVEKHVASTHQERVSCGVQVCLVQNCLQEKKPLSQAR